ncbi:hypothetical protein LguiB_020583 [Lonicera macranthoides]
MDVQVSAQNTIVPKDHAIARQSANFHPSIWGYHFLKYDSELIKIDADTKEQLLQLKEEMRMMVVTGGCGGGGPGDEEAAAAQQLMDEDGRFKESLIEDTRGLLSLYEAAHMRVDKEDVLDESLAFTTAHLEQVMLKNSSCNNSLLASQVVHALDKPIRKGLTRFQHVAKTPSEGAYPYHKMKELAKAYFEEAKWYDEGYVPTLQEYMKIDELANAYFEEAKWYDEGYVPTLEEYMKIDVCVLTRRGTSRYARKLARASHAK